MLLDGSDELLGGDLDAEVDNLEAGTLEHDVDEVLADVMDVALDGAHHELADRLGALGGQEWAQNLEGSGHRLASDQHLGDEPVAALETRADLFEARDQRIEEQRLRVHAHLEACVGQLDHGGSVTDHRLVIEVLENFFWCHAAPSSRWWWLRRTVSSAAERMSSSPICS